jgi:alkyl sulfatase BDS1-like metallo-beta-lactamase superfamily hydrolase
VEWVLVIGRRGRVCDERASLILCKESMNKGLTPDELVQVLKLPPHLAGYKPWMQEFFGTVRQAVRGIYQGYLGWFEGDPVALAQLPRSESARREVELMGGRDRVLAAADKAFEDGDSQWAAELATRLIHINHDDMEARRLKAAAFRKLGYAEMNAIWRNWYLSGARGLEIVDPEVIRAGMARLARFIASPDLVAALPAKAFVEGFAVRLKAEETLDVVMTVGSSDFPIFARPTASPSDAASHRSRSAHPRRPISRSR